MIRGSLLPLALFVALHAGCDPAQPVDLVTQPDTGSTGDAMAADASMTLDGGVDAGEPSADLGQPGPDDMMGIDAEFADMAFDADNPVPDAEAPEPDAELPDTCGPESPCPAGSQCETIEACPPAAPRCFGVFGSPCEASCDCGGVLYCDAQTGSCVECLNDANCTPLVCSDEGRCID